MIKYKYLLLPLGCLMAVCLFVAFQVNSVFKKSDDKARVVLGNIGGVAVGIPKENAYFVEYDGDSGFFAPGKKHAIPRTIFDNVRSFGFGVRYDRSTLDLVDESLLSTRTGAIHVGVLSNSAYSSDQAIVNLVDATSMISGYRYERNAATQFGLEVYIPKRVGTGQHTSSEHFIYEIYVHRDSEGAADMFIQCQISKVPDPLCNAHFLLQPDMRAEVNLSFRKSYLPEWKNFSYLIRKKIISFSLSPDTIAH